MLPARNNYQPSTTWSKSTANLPHNNKTLDEDQIVDLCVKLNIAVQRIAQNDFTQALATLLPYKNSAAIKDNKVLASSLKLTFLQIYSELGDLQSSQEYVNYFSPISDFEQLLSRQQKGAYYQALGKLDYEKGNYAQSRDYFKLVESVNEHAQPSILDVATSGNNIAATYLMEQDFTSAISRAKSVLDLFSKSNTKVNLSPKEQAEWAKAAYLIAQASLADEKASAETKIEHFQNFISLARQTKLSNPAFIEESYIQVGLLASEIKKYDSARDCYNSLLSWAKANNHPCFKAYFHLGQLYSLWDATGNELSAINNFSLALSNVEADLAKDKLTLTPIKLSYLLECNRAIAELNPTQAVKYYSETFVPIIKKLLSLKYANPADGKLFSLDFPGDHESQLWLINVLKNLATDFHAQGQIEQANNLAVAALKLELSLDLCKDAYEIAVTNSQLGALYLQLNNKTAALAAFIAGSTALRRSAALEATEVGVKLLAYLSYQAASIFFDQQSSAEAEIYLKDGLALLNKASSVGPSSDMPGETILKSAIFLKMADIYFQSSKKGITATEKAYAYYILSLKALEGLGSNFKAKKVYLHYQIANLYYQKLDFVNALEHYTQALELTEAKNDKHTKELVSLIKQVGIFQYYEQKLSALADKSKVLELAQEVIDSFVDASKSTASLNNSRLIFNLAAIAYNLGNLQRDKQLACIKARKQKNPAASLGYVDEYSLAAQKYYTAASNLLNHPSVDSDKKTEELKLSIGVNEFAVIFANSALQDG